MYDCSHLVGGSFRDFAARMADSPLLQWFCQVGQLDRVKVPAKSTLQRYATWLPEEEMREVINGLLRNAGAAITDGKQVLDLDGPLDLSTMFMDTTCLKANIHFPVDWVLLRDRVKSLMQSVELIRSHGLKSRMCEPQEFITKINSLSMEMTHTRRKKNSNKERKRLLREMKRVVRVVRAHAQRYYTLLEENWQACSNVGHGRAPLSPLSSSLAIAACALCCNFSCDEYGSFPWRGG
jgi:hypothetical protein